MTTKYGNTIRGDAVYTDYECYSNQVIKHKLLTYGVRFGYYTIISVCVCVCGSSRFMLTLTHWIYFEIIYGIWKRSNACLCSLLVVHLYGFVYANCMFFVDKAAVRNDGHHLHIPEFYSHYLMYYNLFNMIYNTICLHNMDFLKSWNVYNYLYIQYNLRKRAAGAGMPFLKSSNLIFVESMFHRIFPLNATIARE